MRVRPLKGKVLADDIDRGDRIVNGIILTDDNMRERGIRARWVKIHSCGEGVEDIKPGDYVLVEHTRWTVGMKIIINDEEIELRLIDYPNGTMAVWQGEGKPY